MFQMHDVIFFHGHHLGERTVGRGRKKMVRETEWERRGGDGGRSRRERKKMSRLKPFPLRGEPEVLDATISMGSNEQN